MEIPILTRTQDGDPRSPVRRLTEETFGLIYWSNTVIGHAVALSVAMADMSWAPEFQRRLFRAGQDVDHATYRVTADDVRWIRGWRVQWEALVLPQPGFILPGGTAAAARWQEAAAMLMQSRRLLARLARRTPINARVAEFLDESAFACFVQGRVINRKAGHPEIPVIDPNA